MIHSTKCKLILQIMLLSYVMLFITKKRENNVAEEQILPHVLNLLRNHDFFLLMCQSTISKLFKKGKNCKKKLKTQKRRSFELLFLKKKTQNQSFADIKSQSLKSQFQSSTNQVLKV